MDTNRTALIGATGFVGSFLGRGTAFDAEFSSRTIGNIRGQHFERIVCCGVPAVKWAANREPEVDRRSINALTDALRATECDELIHISTIDVYGRPVGVNEDDEGDQPGDEPYGRHRRELEDELRSFMPLVRAIRLPALFGSGLKKNVLFDLINDHRTEFINPASVFQWYSLDDLAGDIERVSEFDLTTVNLTSEPIGVQDIIDQFFPDAVVGPSDASTASKYDVRSKWAELWGGQQGYMYSSSDVMDKLHSFIASQRLPST